MKTDTRLTTSVLSLGRFCALSLRLALIGLVLHAPAATADTTNPGSASVDNGATAEGGTKVASSGASDFDPKEARQQAMVGFVHLRGEEYEAARKAFSLALARWPNHPQVAYGLALSETALGNAEVALEHLRGLVRQGYALPVADEAGFEALHGREGYTLLLRELEALNGKVLGTSEQVFSLAERDLIPEAVVFDPPSGAYFISSVHHRKILRRSSDGKVTPFAADGLWAVSGLAVDAEHRLLWAATSAMPQMRGFRPQEAGQTALVAFDLDTGDERLRFENRQPGHQLGDLTVASNGDVYVSDGADGSGRVWRTVMTASAAEDTTWRRRPGTLPASPTDTNTADTVVDPMASRSPLPLGLEVISPPDLLRSPQGLALTADGRHLFVADYSFGLLACELARGEWFHLAEPPGMALLGIDGLSVSGEDLVAIQNGLRPQRILRLRPDLAARRVSAGEVLAMHLPQWSEPTLGTVVGDALVYVGNSQWDRFDGEGQLPSVEHLSPPSIQRLQLRPWTVAQPTPAEGEED